MTADDSISNRSCIIIITAAVTADPSPDKESPQRRLYWKSGYKIPVIRGITNHEFCKLKRQREDCIKKP